MKRFACCLTAVVMSSSTCSGRSPVEPGVQQPPEAVSQFATVNGWVYGRGEGADPPIAGALIEVKEADGSEKSTLTDEDGFYELAVRAGNVSITASKEGYEAKTWQLTLLKDTVLNFGLALK
jgi:hypothetical protein